MEKNKPAEKKQVIYHSRKNCLGKKHACKEELGHSFSHTAVHTSNSENFTCKISPVTGRRVCPSGRGAFGSGLVAAEQ